jgi:hypothetical protein
MTSAKKGCGVPIMKGRAILRTVAACVLLINASGCPSGTAETKDGDGGDAAWDSGIPYCGESCNVPDCCLPVNTDCPAMMPREGDECAPLGLDCAYGCETFPRYYVATCLRLAGTWAHSGFECDEQPEDIHGSPDGGSPDGGSPDGESPDGGSLDAGSLDGGPPDGV